VGSRLLGDKTLDFRRANRFVEVERAEWCEPTAEPVGQRAHLAVDGSPRRVVDARGLRNFFRLVAQCEVFAGALEEVFLRPAGMPATIRRMGWAPFYPGARQASHDSRGSPALPPPEASQPPSGRVPSQGLSVPGMSERLSPLGEEDVTGVWKIVLNPQSTTKLQPISSSSIPTVKN